jgi:hypothetical protein
MKKQEPIRNEGTDDDRERLKQAWLRTRPLDQEKARYQLRKLAKALDEQSFRRASWAIRAYLRGLASSLDQAFGIADLGKRQLPPSQRTLVDRLLRLMQEPRRPGRPRARTPKEDWQLARQVDRWLVRQVRSGLRSSDREFFRQQYNVRDKRELERLCAGLRRARRRATKS